MSVKRALIVDDSRSARVILSRMLETHGLQVDTAESAEQALDYLRSARPDVVFMDHLMPGMDGFEAVRAIKANAQTASIPVMMYTSQEGAHYLQEARRIGAMGVLSKTLKPTDVSRALYELNLLADRRDLRVTPSANAERIESYSSSSVLAPSAAAVSAVPASTPVRAATSAEMRATVTAMVEEQQGELHQLLQSSLDAMSNRLSAELRAAAQQAAMPSSAGTDTESNSRGWLAVVLILVALIPTAVIAALYWRTLNDNQAQLEQSTSRLAMVVTDQQTQIEQLRAELRKRQDAGEPVLPGPHAETITVPYGELPLSGARVQRLQAMLERLNAEGFHGKLSVASFVGDFCLTGNALNGYALAHDQLPIRRCDLTGNPYDDSLTAGQRHSAELAAALANLKTANATNKISIEFRTQGRKPTTAYPPQTDRLTAGEWNRVAARNHRVELTAIAD
jgi:CheY-like chemotaxis protein